MSQIERYENVAVTLSDDLVRCWWEYQRLLRGTPQERRALEAGHPAAVYFRWNDANARIARGGPPALDLIVALLAACPDEDGITLVATGPLEDLVRKHGDQLIDDIEYLAAVNERFRSALGAVWLPTGVLTPQARWRLSRWVPVSGPTGW